MVEMVGVNWHTRRATSARIDMAGINRSETIKAASTLVPHTVEIVTTYLQQSPLPDEQVSELVKGVHGALLDILVDTRAINALRNWSLKRNDAFDARAEARAFMSRMASSSARPRFAAAAPAVPAGGSPMGPLRKVPTSEVTETVSDSVVVPFPSDKVRRDTPSAPVIKQPVEETPETPKTVSGAASPAQELGDATVEVRPFQKPAKPRQIELPITAPIPPKGVTVQNSVGMDYVICLEDGRKVRDLVQHLAEHHDMTPDAYRAKWGLPREYPMHPPSVILKRGTQFELAPVTGVFIPLQK